NSASIAKKLSQRSKARLTGWSVQGGYLRIFQEEISSRSARKLVTRYLGMLGKAKRSLTTDKRVTNARFLGLERPLSSRQQPTAILTLPVTKRASAGDAARARKRLPLSTLPCRSMTACRCLSLRQKVARSGAVSTPRNAT